MDGWNCAEKCATNRFRKLSSNGLSKLLDSGTQGMVSAATSLQVSGFPGAREGLKIGFAIRSGVCSGIIWM